MLFKNTFKTKKLKKGDITISGKLIQDVIPPRIGDESGLWKILFQDLTWEYSSKDYLWLVERKPKKITFQQLLDDPEYEPGWYQRDQSGCKMKFYKPHDSAFTLPAVFNGKVLYKPNEMFCPGIFTPTSPPTL